MAATKRLYASKLQKALLSSMPWTYGWRDFPRSHKEDRKSPQLRRCYWQRDLEVP